MEKKITGYTTVDISQWHRKEHFEAFQSVAQCTYNQTVQLGHPPDQFPCSRRLG
ncbi:CatA-like O-acetyltransferase, partial [Salmonella enterica]